MASNGAWYSGSHPQQPFKPLYPRALAPAPPNHAPLPNPAVQHSPTPEHSPPPNHSPPQHGSQVPPQAHSMPPYGYPYIPMNVTQHSPSDSHYVSRESSPTANNHEPHQLHDQSLYQASPGGPYRPAPSLASEQPLRYAATYLGPPHQHHPPQSPQASGTSQGGWYQNISQAAYNLNSNWQPPYMGNPYTPQMQHSPYPQSPQSAFGQWQNTMLSASNNRGSLESTITGQSPRPTTAKKPRKPRVTKKKSDLQQGVGEPSGNGHDNSDPQTQPKPTPVKKARKPRGPNKTSKPPQSAQPLQLAPKPVTREIRPQPTNIALPQALQQTIEFEPPTVVRTDSREEHGTGSAPPPTSSTEFDAVFTAKRLESRAVVEERGHENSARKVPKVDPKTSAAVIGSEPSSMVPQPQSRQWQRVESPDDDSDSDSDEESGEDNEFGKIMSQVSKYKGGLLKAMGGLRQDNHAGYDLLDELPDEQEEVEDETEPTPKDPNRIRRVKHRGPHAAADVTGEIKMRLGLANHAFAESKIDEAKVLVDEIIRINAETYEAWNLLSSIFQEQNLVEDALMALIVAAHLRPKHIEAWFNAAEYALTSMGPLTPKLLGDAQFCYSSAIRQVPTSLEARRRKVEVLLLRQNYNLAARDLVYLLRSIPYDLELIRELAMVYVDLGDGNAGVELYKKAIEHYRKVPDDFDFSINWNDLHSCAVLYSLTTKPAEALVDMKAFARWLLGREDETYWDDITENDCEWDVDDIRRSTSVEKYKPGLHPISAYGKGLPIELRVYFGKYRLQTKHYEEAMRHFKFLLEKSDEAEENMVKSHSHLVADVAKALHAANQFKDCLVFYTILKNELPDEMTTEAYLHMGKCFILDDRQTEAEAAFKEACDIDKSNIEARIQLARMYERMDESDRAFVYVNQVIELESIKQPKMYHRNRGPTSIAPQPGKFLLPGPVRTLRRKKARELQDLHRAHIAAQLRDRYLVLRQETDDMRAGKHRATDAWMDSARALTEDFRSCKAFYPWDRKEFDGYTKEEALKAQTSLKYDLEALNQEHAEDLGSGVSGGSDQVSNHYRGISFKDWIDMFCEYALCLAKRSRTREAYDIIEAGIHAICFMFNKEDMFMLHICYCVCALIGNDEETCVGMARWFMVRYQFSTDSYRMFAALLRMCHSPISWYSSGPTQKFILRQIKTMDWVLSNEKRRSVIKGDKANYTQLDENGKGIANQELDVSLLMAYGHILVAGSSYVYALNYFHRALSVDPQNSLIILSLGLSYIQYGLKRQVDNRQYVITQGLTFMHQYYDMRGTSSHFEERQEAHYNMARTYHLVGLTNLAIPFYQKVLKGADNEKNVKGVNEDWCLDAAYNLQTIYTTAGNMELAQSLTRKWLVI